MGWTKAVFQEYGVNSWEKKKVTGALWLRGTKYLGCFRFVHIP
jgi:hypothetical protein